MNSLESSIRSWLPESADVVHITDLRRSTLLFTQNQATDYLYFIEDGLVKLTRTNHVGDRIILAVRGAGDLVGEEILSEEDNRFHSEAEVLTNASALRIGREAIRKAIGSQDGAGVLSPLIGYLITQKSKLADKVELLCLHDVEYRILYYLAELCKLVKPLESTGDYQIPITQLELADLIGATRETTSTTLNQLERRGLIKLSRRMMTVSSPANLLAGLSPKYKAAGASNDSVPNSVEPSAQPWSN